MATSLTFGANKSLSTFSEGSRHSEHREERKANKAKANSSSSLNFFEKHLNGVAIGVMSCIPQQMLCNRVSKSLTSLGFCLGNFITPAGKKQLEYIGSSLGELHLRIGSIFGKNIGSQVLIPALCEEIEFRWFVQEVLLRKLPKAVLQTIAPKLTELVDSFPARITRVAAAALLFALCHPSVLDCPQGGGASYPLLTGLILGTTYEFTSSLSTCAYVHFFNNSIAYILFLYREVL